MDSEGACELATAQRNAVIRDSGAPDSWLGRTVSRTVDTDFDGLADCAHTVHLGPTENLHKEIMSNSLLVFWMRGENQGGGGRRCNVAVCRLGIGRMC